MAKFYLIMILILLSCSFNLSLAWSNNDFLNNKKVQTFINEMVKRHHFDRAQLVKVFSHVKHNKRILQSMSKPLEKESWSTYQNLFVNEWRIEHGVKFWAKHEEALKRAEKQYGVPASIIVATLGIETKYGQRMGGYRVIESLSNIAFSDSPRAPFFRHELEEFLLLTREEHLDPLGVEGSYAGAIGQPQFMPSSYRHFAVRFVKSDRIDLIHNTDNVIGSVANYYHRAGWSNHEPVAQLAKAAYMNHVAFGKAVPLADLRRYGVIPQKTKHDPHLKAKIIDLSHHHTNEYWIGFHNFDVIKRYNSSDLYAMAVFQLSNYIEKLREKSKHV